MTAALHRRTGFEIELMAPAGRSRRSLAEELARRCGGRIRPVWHHDSEPSLVPGLGRFLHLTQGFAVYDRDDALLCTLVDDITLVAGLDPDSPAAPGWFRILSDDHRLLRLLAAQSDPGGTIGTALDATARFWGVTADRVDDVYRLDDGDGATIALAAPLVGERERPCEIVTPPLVRDHRAALEYLLGPARELGFTVPAEAAVHLHVDGGPFRTPYALANLIRLFGHWRAPLRTILQTNPACTRLAPLPEPLITVADNVPSYDELRAVAADVRLTKYFDVNLTQLLTGKPVRDTVEIRILPGTNDPAAIMDSAAVVELLLDRCTDPEPFPLPPTHPLDAVDALLTVAADVLADREHRC
ncbi:amidoligase family protein [Krasilnikovia sp. MM14-A1259]|uniref:amidoligase family protein n=1 Tax=Krasilnikovia sp. MM14-A1259 TaxID=3373539 RepID=UPI00380D88B0